MSDVKLLVGILEKVANICKNNMLEFKNDVDFKIHCTGYNLISALLYAEWFINNTERYPSIDMDL